MKCSLSGNTWSGSSWDGKSKYTKKTQEQNADGSYETITADFRKYPCIEDLPFSNKSKNPLAFTGILRGKKHKISVPVTAYLIEHPKGLVLIDTGWDTAIRDNARKYEGFANYFASPGFLPDGEAVTEHLARLGFSPKDIDYCIMTHMDIDHAGGIGLVRDAKHIMCSEAEWKAASSNNPRYLKRLWRGIQVETFPDEKYDLFGDKSVILFPLHGHSAGMTGVRVGTRDTWYRNPSIFSGT